MNVMIIPPNGQQQYSDTLEQAFRLRHKVFNETLGWDLPHSHGRETDPYDRNAYHLFAFEAPDTAQKSKASTKTTTATTKIKPGTLAGYWRLSPTTQPTLTGEVFADLFDDGMAPASDVVWEISRFSVDPDMFKGRIQARTRLAAAMCSALMEFAIIHGIAEYISVQDPHITKGARLFFGDPVWQSATVNFGAVDAACYSYAPSLERLYAMRTRYGLGSPVLEQLQTPLFQIAA